MLVSKALDKAIHVAQGTRAHLDPWLRALQVECHTVEDFKAQDDAHDQGGEKVPPRFLGQVGGALVLQGGQLIVWIWSARGH